MQKILKKKEIIILLLILVVAAFLRLYHIADYMTFLGDEGRDSLVLENIVHRKFTLLGPTASVGGFYMGPIYYYLVTPFYFIFRHPVGPSIFVALLGVVTVWFIYKVGAEFYNKTSGLIAAFFYAISPLAVISSRSSWNPNVMPLFTLLTLYVLYKAIAKNKIWLFLIVGILYGIDIQLHYIETFLGLIIILYTFVGTFFYKSTKFVTNIKEYIKRGLIILVGFLVGFSPFLAFEFRHGFENSKNIINFIFFSKDTGAGADFLANIGNVFFRLFSRLLVDFPPYSHIEQMATSRDIVLFIVSILVGVVLTLFFFWHYRQTLKKRDTKFLEYTLLLLWFGIGIVMFGFYKKPIYDYYFQFLFPIPFLFLGAFMAFLWKKNHLYKGIAVISFVLFLFLCLQKSPVLYPANKQLNQTEEISRFVFDKAQGKPFNLALLTSGNSDHAYRYFLTLWGNPPVVIQNSVVDPNRTTVTKQLLVICEYPDCKPLGNSLWEVAGFGSADIAGHWKISVVEIYKLVPLGNKN